MKNKDFNTVFITLSVILLLFGVFYGIWFFNRGKKESTIEVAELEDTYGLKYKIDEINIEYPSKVIGNKYLEYLKSDNVYKYSNLNNETIIDNIEKLELGYDKELYYLESGDNYLNISTIKDGTLTSIYSVNKTIEFFGKVYYSNNDNLLLMGVVITSEGKDYYYMIKDNSIKEYKFDDYYFIGDNYYNELDYFVTHDKRYIVLSSSGHNSIDNPVVYDLDKEEVLFDNRYDDIITIGNSQFIVSNNNKTIIINNKGNSLTIPYEFIDKVGDYYLVSRDKNIAILDENKRVITDFEIPYYGNNYEYHTLYNKTYNTYKYKNMLIIEPYKVGEFSTEIYYLLDKKLYKVNDSNFYIEDFIYSYNEESSLLNIYNDSFKQLYSININDYFDGIPYYELEFKKYGNTLALSKDNIHYYFDYVTGEIKDTIEDYEQSINSNITIKIHYDLDKGNIFTININGVDYTDYKCDSKDINELYKKVKNKYLIFSDNKYMIISKE